MNIVNNTVVKNLTTATAVTSDGSAAPTGLSTAANSDPLQARLSNTTLFPQSSTLATTVFSKPTLFNNVFWDNRAGSFSGGFVYGISTTLPDGTPDTINNWDMGASDGSGLLAPTNSVMQTTTGITASPTNVITDTPGLAAPYDVTVNILASRMYPAFRQAIIVAQILPPSLMGNYHLADATSPARGRGAASTLVRWGPAPAGWNFTVNAPSTDIDGQARGSLPARRYDAGSDQLIP